MKKRFVKENRLAEFDTDKFLKQYNNTLKSGGGASNSYYLTVDLDERGEYAATLYDYDDNVVWDCDTEQVQEMIEDGFLKYKPDEDLDGLAEYLGDIGVIPKGSDIGSEKVEETKMKKGFTQVKEASNSDGTTKFVKYFNDFYGPNGLYPCKMHKKDITWEEIKKGYDAVLKKNPKHRFDGDSVDRELIRDEMIDLKILDPTYNKTSNESKFSKKKLLEFRLRNKIRPIVEKVLRENQKGNINFVANKLSQLAHQLHDYDFDVRNRKEQIQKMWDEVKDIMNTYDPNELIDAVKYRNESKLKEGVYNPRTESNKPVKYLSKEDGERLGISEFPNFSSSGSVSGMKKQYYGKGALLVKCGSYIYHVSSQPEIYFDEASDRPY